MSAFYKIAFGVLSVLMPAAFKIKKEGTENLPQGGGCLYVSNHRSNADPILIGLQNRKAQFCFLAKQELFSKGLVGWVLRKLGAVAVDRGTGDLSPLDELRSRLENGENALIFPEGTRSKDGSLGRFKTGAALIAAQSGVPVVPVGISFEGKLHFRSRITVRFGEPFQVPQTDPDNPAPAVLKQVRQEMTQRVSALLPAPPTALPMQKDASDQKGELKS
ncbi:MAG: 1-acyl-sn-glycerol-3-phosphate acyltransferase [Oscillospiraceae bacterium]|nr:1-acyl-sn-glycerol-3-phosphate acyltransferase [Oscillospiraceae bacterium]